MSPIPYLAGSNAPHGAVVPIAKFVCSDNSTGQITFSNIPQKYQDLYMVGSVRTTTVAGITAGAIYTNSTGTSQWSLTKLYADGYNAVSSRATAPYYGTLYYGMGAIAAPNIFTSFEYHLLNYANTSTYKTTLMRTANDFNGTGSVELIAGLNQLTAGINEIDLQFGNSFAAGSTVTLYGVRSIGQ